MWCKCNGASLTWYDPYIINLDNGNRIYLSNRDYDDKSYTIDTVELAIKETGVVYILKKSLRSLDIEIDEYNAPLSDVIDDIYKQLKKQSKAFEID